MEPGNSCLCVLHKPCTRYGGLPLRLSVCRLSCLQFLVISQAHETALAWPAGTAEMGPAPWLSLDRVACVWCNVGFGFRFTVRISVKLPGACHLHHRTGQTPSLP